MRPRSPSDGHKEQAPKYNGKSDFLDYICQFECQAEDNGWTYEEQGRKLSRCLTDDARAVLSSLEPRVRRDYNTLYAALISLHTVPGSERLMQSQLLDTKCEADESAHKYGQKLRRLALRAYPGGEFPESGLVSIFIKGLPSAETSRYVALQAPRSLNEAVRLASVYRAYDSPSPGNTQHRKPKPAIVNTISLPHGTAGKADNRLEAIEKQLEVIMERLQQPPRRQQEVECFACHEKGHYANVCPNRRNLEPKRPQTQFHARANMVSDMAEPSNTVLLPPQQPYRFPEETNRLNF